MSDLSINYNKRGNENSDRSRRGQRIDVTDPRKPLEIVICGVQSQPYSIARAARCASEVRFPAVPVILTRLRKTGQWCLPGRMNDTKG